MFSQVVAFSYNMKISASHATERVSPSDALPPGGRSPATQHRRPARWFLKLLRVPDSLLGGAWFKCDTLIFYKPSHIAGPQLPQ